jgi:hypothetical protein
LDAVYPEKSIRKKNDGEELGGINPERAKKSRSLCDLLFYLEI